MAFRLFSKESKEKDNIPEMVDLKPGIIIMDM